jgi:hypothetical protein
LIAHQRKEYQLENPIATPPCDGGTVVAMGVNEQPNRPDSETSTVTEIAALTARVEALERYLAELSPASFAVPSKPKSIGKTFLYEMRDLSQGYRVVSFLGLGALLMAISFAYQKDWLSLRKPAHPSNEPAAGATR